MLLPRSPRCLQCAEIVLEVRTEKVVHIFALNRPRSRGTLENSIDNVSATEWNTLIFEQNRTIEVIERFSRD